MSYDIKLTEPSLLNWGELMTRINKVALSGIYTLGEQTRELEFRMAEYLGVRDVVAVSSCTSGMMLVLMGLPPQGKIVLTPSFSFSATSLAIMWAGLKPRFVEADWSTFNMDPSKIEKQINKDSGTILATHIFGNPCYYHRLNDIAEKHHLHLIFDAAHAIGSRYAHGSKVGCGGIAEIFSLAPSKVLTGGEGGLIATNDLDLAEKLRYLRNYGHKGDYNTVYVGLNARMSEFNAAVALTHLTELDKRINHRARLVKEYREYFDILGIAYQRPIGVPNNSYFAIKTKNRDQIAENLKKHGIETKKYFFPPIHLQRLFQSYSSPNLPITEELSREVLCLPLHSGLRKKDIAKICSYIIC